MQTTRLTGIVLTNSLKIIAVLLSETKEKDVHFMRETASIDFISWLPKYVNVMGTKNAHFLN
jgi:hypothetical protein